MTAFDEERAIKIASLEVRVQHVEDELSKLREERIVDSTARERIQEMSLAFWGPNKDNGVRSQVKELTDWRNDYLQTDRVATCVGKAALEDYAKHEASKIAEETAIRVAKINAKGANWREIIILVGVLLSTADGFITAQQNMKLQSQLVAIQRTVTK